MGNICKPGNTTPQDCHSGMPTKRRQGTVSDAGSKSRTLKSTTTDVSSYNTASSSPQRAQDTAGTKCVGPIRRKRFGGFLIKVKKLKLINNLLKKVARDEEA